MCTASTKYAKCPQTMHGVCMSTWCLLYEYACIRIHVTYTSVGACGEAQQVQPVHYTPPAINSDAQATNSNPRQATATTSNAHPPAKRQGSHSGKNNISSEIPIRHKLKQAKKHLSRLSKGRRTACGSGVAHRIRGTACEIKPRRN